MVLNACYSENQARAIVETIDFVVGMSDAIDDRAARRFAVAFYRGLGFGRSLRLAFDLGVSEIKLGGHDEDVAIPVLYSRRGVDPSETILVSRPQASDR